MIDKTDPTNRDTVPAMLTPGEFVLNKEATQMFGPVVEQMNNAGLQHRAMKNMGGSIQNYNDGSTGGVKASPYTYEDKIAFIKEITPHANRVGAKLGIDPKLIIAQAIQETGWGEYAKGNNYFGIKSHGKGNGQTFTTHEVIDGKKVKIQDDFRKYDNMSQSVEDYGNFLLNNPRYKNVLEADGLDAQVEAMGNSGYATDPNYGDALSNIIDGRTFVNNYTSTTVSETPQPTTQTASTEPVPRLFSGGGKDGKGSFGMIGDFFGGVTTPSVAPIVPIPPKMRPKDLAPQMVAGITDSMSSSRPQMRPNTQVDPLAVEQAVMQASVPQIQAVPPTPTNFNEAFREARADMGAGGIFNFRGRDYSTNYAEEEDKRMTANMGGSVYLNTGGLSIDQMARRKLQEDVDNAWFKRNERDALTKFDQANLALRKMPQRFDSPSPMQTNIDSLPMALPSGSSQQGPSMPDQGGPRRVPPMSPPMPDVNSDESLLQGSSQSVENAASSYPSDYSIMAAANMAVPKISSPPPAPRPTMIGGKLYYLNSDGSVTDGNGNPVQNPSIGAAVQDKLNYSAEESAANAEAYNDSMAEQAVFNGVAPQSVNPSYDSMRRQQESNAAEAERIRKEIAETNAKREALRVAYNNRDTPVVPQLESNSVPLNNLVPPNPNENDTRNLGGAEGYGPSSSPPKSFNPAFEGKDLEELYNMFAVNGGQGFRADPTLAQALTKEIEAREAAGESFNVYDTSLHNAAALYGGGNRPEVERQQFVADTSSRNAEKAAAVLAAQQAELQAKLDAGTVTQLDIDSFERQRRATTQAQAVAARNEETAKLTAEQQAALIGPATDIESDNAEATKALREAESKRLQSYDPITGTYSNTNEPKKSPGDVFSEVEGKVDEVRKAAQPTTTVQENAARKNADNVDLNKVDKGDQRVAGAMDTIKSVFGDLFDSKELVRAAVMYLGGRATGMDNQQALAFAGKTYLAREEAKGVRTQKFVDKLISDGKHKMGSIAAYKKSLDPNDLELIGLTFLETGNTGTYYAPNAAGNFVTLQLKEMKGSDGGFYLKDSKGNSYDPSKLHQDPKRVKGTPEYRTALAQEISLYKDTFENLREQRGIVTNRMDGKPAVYKTDLESAAVAADTAAWALRYGVPLQMVPSLMTEAYSLAIGGKDINGKPIRAQKIEPYLNQLWITQSAGDPNNFKIGKGDKAKFVETSTVSSWVTNVHNQMKEVNPEFNAVTPIRFSTWLRQTDISGQWSLPEEQGGLSQEARNEITKRGNAVGKSGYMQYILEEAAKNYEKSLNKPTT